MGQRTRPEKIRCSTPDFTFGIVGEHAYREQLWHLRATGEASFEVLLRREPRNPYDPWAVAAIVNGVGTIGYLRRADARAVADELERLEADGKVICCEGRLIGGQPPDKPDLGVLLDLNFLSLVAPASVPTPAAVHPARHSGCLTAVIILAGVAAGVAAAVASSRQS